MTDGIYGCDGCRTTLGRAGCRVHADPPQLHQPAPVWVQTPKPDPWTEERVEKVIRLLESIDLTLRQGRWRD